MADLQAIKDSLPEEERQTIDQVRESDVVNAPELQECA